MLNNAKEAFPHGSITEVFENVFMVTGCFIKKFNDQVIQDSRNMVIVREGTSLTLINSVRLSEDGLIALEKLGTVTHVIRIGAFHGYDDAFYCERYRAKLWAPPHMQDEHNKSVDNVLRPDGEKPFKDCSVYTFENANPPEVILHLSREGGILVTCDSVKNWTQADEFFSAETVLDYEKQGTFGEANIESKWMQACGIESEDFQLLFLRPFKHLLSAHGAPLYDKAFESLQTSVNLLSTSSYRPT